MPLLSFDLWSGRNCTTKHYPSHAKAKGIYILSAQRLSISQAVCTDECVERFFTGQRL